MFCSSLSLYPANYYDLVFARLSQHIYIPYKVFTYLYTIAYIPMHVYHMHITGVYISLYCIDTAHIAPNNRHKHTKQ